jgi:microcystin degradation protein MlrC
VRSRIAIGGLWHETNTFAAGRTTLDDFAAYRLAQGAEAVRDEAEGTATELGGALAACAELGLQAAPFFDAAAVPGPLGAAEAYETLRDAFLAGLGRALPADGVLLCLHGAMVAEGAEDPESDLVGRVRELVGSAPIAVVLDLHANPGAALVKEADILLAYDTYPHTDMAERAAEATGLLAEAIEGELAPAVAARRVPLLTCPLAQATDTEPMAGLLAAARRLQARPGIARVSLAPGFAYADVDRLGFAVLVTGEGPAGAEVADELAGEVWNRRDGFRPQLVGITEAIERALAADGQTVLAEVADNVGGGAPGDSTHALGPLIEAGASGAVAVLFDPEAAEAAASAQGEEVELEVGHPRLLLRGRVASAAEASYRRSGSYMTGSHVDMGLCAVVEADGVEVVLTSRRVMPFDAEHLAAVGIDAPERRILLVKSAVAWRAGFPGAEQALALDTPGVTSCRLESVPYTRRPSPLYPLDPV